MSRRLRGASMLSFGSSKRDGNVRDGARGDEPRREAHADREPVARAERPPSLLSTCVAGIDHHWPNLKYLSLAFYSAWILLTMTGNSVTSNVSVPIDAGVLSAELYLLSGVPLAVCLIGSAVFQCQAARLMESRPFSLAMGLIASVATYVLSMGGALPGLEESRAAFVVCSIATGVGTAFVCLRIGCLYSTPPQGRVPFFTITQSMLVANLLFFMVVCLPDGLRQVVLGLLPVLAAATAMLGSDSPDMRKDATDLVSVASLPRGYFPKLLIAVAVCSVAVGVTKGFSALMQSADDVSSQTVVITFLSFVIVGAITLVAGAVLAVRNYEVSKLFFPLIVCACAAILLCAVTGPSMGAVQNIVVNVGYNVFIVAIWALLSDLAERTTIAPVRVFGLGRGASGLGTTVGWFVAYGVMSFGADPSAFLVPFFFVATVLVFAAVFLVLGQQTVSEALERTLEGRALAVAPAGAGGAEPDPHDAWDRYCAELAAEYGLTTREEEVLRLLSRGRTNGYIALELCISQNTVKGHTRNVYAKAGVHSRQELIDAIEHRIPS